MRVGNYRLLAQLGSGGMADVYLAVDDRLAVTKLAVVKRVRSHLVDDADLVALLLEEARVSARLNHPNVVQVLDAGTDRGECYLAMEYLDGQSLSALVKRAGARLSLDVELTILSDVLRGLHYAHELTDFDGKPLAIVHRDVSPQNIFVTYDGVVKLLDFGIAKAAGRATETREGFFRGKIRYMPPEQALQQSIDARCDVFAAGLLIWQAIAGRRFWGDASDPEVMDRLVSGRYESSPRQFRPDMPDALEVICRRALAYAPADRYPSAAVMLADLEDYLGDRIVEHRRALVAAMRELFADDRQKRREVIQDLSATAAIGSSLGAIVLRGSTGSSGGTMALELDPKTSVARIDETESLASRLEPSLAHGRRRGKRRRLGALVAGISLIVFAGGLAIVGQVQRRATAATVGAQAERDRAAAADERTPLERASDRLERTQRPPSMIAPTPPHGHSASVVSGTAPAAHLVTGRGAPKHGATVPSTAPQIPRPEGVPTSAPTKSPDSSDPWR